ncbi:hypothetical protein COY60_02220 [Candidatus Gracilibacteria bacterium CG_4_10_14_0_8_um_filter_38_28]|nr:MAG: hypothetical protein COY60_02220 [Candidatus Gracilibacteria bacterium CG_4_10_14_0_8_um_filter_38_28]
MYINNLAVYFAYHTTVIYSVLIVCIIFLLVLILKDYFKSRALINFSVGFMILCIICTTILSRTGNVIIIGNLLKQGQENEYRAQYISCLKKFSGGFTINGSDDICLNFYKEFIGKIEKEKSIRFEVAEINKKIQEYVQSCDGVDLLHLKDNEKNKTCFDYSWSLALDGIKDK